MLKDKANLVDWWFLPHIIQWNARQRQTNVGKYQKTEWLLLIVLQIPSNFVHRRSRHSYERAYLFYKNGSYVKEDSTYDLNNIKANNLLLSII